MKTPLLILLLALVLVACGQPTVAEADVQIRAYADTIQAGDVTKARTLISNPSIDWSEAAEKLGRYQVQGYTLRDEVQSAIGYEATIVWQTAKAADPFCSYVRVRKDTGVLEMVKDTTFLCPKPDVQATP